MPKLCVMPGDGIGKEVVPTAVSILQALIPNLEIIEAAAGWETFQQTGHSVPLATLETIRACGAGLFGAVQSPMHRVEGYRSAILTMRQDLELYANIRPVRSLPTVSPRPGIDLIVVRENSEGLYSGQEHSDGETAVAERIITRAASRRIAEKTAVLMAQHQRKTLTIVHKANVLPLTDGLFRDTVREVMAEKAPHISINELLVDVAALHMVGNPERFDVIVTTNLFGDILSDAAAYWGGGLGLAPSLNWGNEIAVAEPVHGSAPDIAGKGLANPMAAILSGAMLARMVWQLPQVATRIETAVYNVLANGINLQTGPVTERVKTAVLAELAS